MGFKGALSLSLSVALSLSFAISLSLSLSVTLSPYFSLSLSLSLPLPLCHSLALSLSFAISLSLSSPHKMHVHMSLPPSYAESCVQTEDLAGSNAGFSNPLDKLSDPQATPSVPDELGSSQSAYMEKALDDPWASDFHPSVGSSSPFLRPKSLSSPLSPRKNKCAIPLIVFPCRTTCARSLRPAHVGLRANQRERARGVLPGIAHKREVDLARLWLPVVSFGFLLRVNSLSPPSHLLNQRGMAKLVAVSAIINLF